MKKSFKMMSILFVGLVLCLSSFVLASCKKKEKNEYREITDVEWSYVSTTNETLGLYPGSPDEKEYICFTLLCKTNHRLVNLNPIINDFEVRSDLKTYNLEGFVVDAENGIYLTAYPSTIQLGTDAQNTSATVKICIIREPGADHLATLYYKGEKLVSLY